MTASPVAVRILELFTRPRTLDEAGEALPEFTPGSVRREVARLERLGFLLPARRRRAGVAAQWKGATAAAFFHFATRDLVYRADGERFYRERLEEERQPPRFKTYRGLERVPLPPWPGNAAPSLDACLLARRTARRFSPRPVPFASLAAVLTGALGQTGWVEDPLLGRQILKTSPSGGARHPIEGYCLAWNVEGLAPGLYHYAVKANALERLRRGDFRREAALFAAGQRWVSGAAFAIVLTAEAARTFWKYPGDDAYRVLLLDAGHVAQTLCLLATAERLGSFTTAALAETRIERFLRIDGVREPPLYIVGAGMLSRARTTVTPSTTPRQP